VPTEAVQADTPEKLSTLATGADRVAEAAAAGNWSAATNAVATMDAAWRSFRGGEVPHLEVPWVDRALSSLAATVRAKDELRARQASIDVEQRIVDLELRYRSPLETDLARFGLWTTQLLVDADAHDAEAVNGDVFTLFYMRDRIIAALTPAQLTDVNTLIDRLQVAAAATKLGDVVARIETATGG
jgi:hypothetical protein